MLRLKEKFNKEIIPAMMEKFGYKSAMAVPRVDKVVVNTGFGRIMTAKTGDDQKKFLESVLQDLTIIAGQKPNVALAKKSISTFKLRQGMPIGAVVTLRGQRMYDFLERFINIALPRSRDFRGINPKSFDKKGNLTIGIKEHIIFPEISPEKSKITFGFEVIISTTADNPEQGIELLKLMGLPIKKGQ